MTTLEQLSESVQNGDLGTTAQLTEQAIAENIPPKDILEKALIAGMAVVGERFQNNEIFVPEMLIAARAMNKALEILEPIMLKNKVSAKGTLVLATVKGDLHDIGKNLVGIMFKGAGYKVVDLGIDVSDEKIVNAALENNADLIGLSALLTTTMVNMKSVVEACKTSNVASKILLGGAPITNTFAKEIGADGYAADAYSAVQVADNLLQ
jgi:5-methyltetrahydrofolate--homocysteine methyltransferase